MALIKSLDFTGGDDTRLDVFDSDFTRNSTATFIVRGSGEDTLKVDNVGGDGVQYYSAATGFTDCCIVVDIRNSYITDTWVGMAIRHTYNGSDTHTMYTFSINNSRDVCRLIYHNATGTDVTTDGTAITAETALPTGIGTDFVSMKFEAIGTTLTGTIDGEEAITGTDSNIASGSFAFIGRDEQGFYDNLVFSTIEAAGSPLSSLQHALQFNRRKN